VLVLIDCILDILSFGFADLSLIAALGAISLLFNAMIATRFLQERMTRRDSLGTFLVFAGTTTSVIFANRKTPAYAVDQLVRNLLEPTFFIWVSTVGLLLTAGGVSIRKLKRQAIERHPELSRRSASNGDEGTLARSESLVPPEQESAPTQLHRSELLEFLRGYHAVLYAACAGLAGGQAISFAKSAVEIVKSAAWGGTDHFVSGPGPWLIILATVVMVLLQFHFLNEGLRLFDALSIIPVYQAAWIFCGVMGGFVYLGEAAENSRTTWQLALFVFGGAVTIVGVALLAKHQPSDDAGLDTTSSHQTGAVDIGAPPRNRRWQRAGCRLCSEAAWRCWAGLVGDTFPIRQSADGAPGAFTLSRQSLEHMSSHDQKTLVGPPEWLTCGFGSHSVTERVVAGRSDDRSEAAAAHAAAGE